MPKKKQLENILGSQLHFYCFHSRLSFLLEIHEYRLDQRQAVVREMPMMLWI